MKKYKGIKITFIILTIILLSMISFVGIFVQDKNEIKNIMPEYILGRDLKGHRRVELKVDADEVLTQENYERTQKIIEKRLKTMQVKDYVIRQNKEDGTIILELPENSNTDRVVGQLSLQGKFEIVDKDTEEVLMTNSDLKSVKAGYGTTSSGVTAIFINIQFNKEGTEKFKNITNTYVQTTVEKEENEAVNEVANEVTGEEAKEEEDKEETITKEIAIKIDNSTLLTTYFDGQITNGLLQLTVGSSNSSTTADMQEYLLEANSMSALLDSGKMPIVYEIEQNKYVFSDVTINEIGIAISIAIVVLTIGMIYLVIKYKVKGILGSISLIGYIAVMLIAVRFFNVEISIGGIVGILLSIAVSYCMLANILKQKEVMQVIKKYAIILIPSLIIAIVFTFMNISIGTTLFWGIVIGLLYNLSITNIILKD